MLGAIGQFCGLYFSAPHDKLQLVYFPVRPISLRDIINILSTNLVFLVRTVSYRSLFPPINSWHINQQEKTQSVTYRYGPQTWLVRGIYTKAY